MASLGCDAPPRAEPDPRAQPIPEPGSGSGATGVSISGRVKCNGARSTGTGVYAESAVRVCLDLATQGAVLDEIGAGDSSVCAQVYGGPQHAKIEGSIAGRSIDVSVERTDSCGIAAWDRLQWLSRSAAGDAVALHRGSRQPTGLFRGVARRNFRARRSAPLPGSKHAGFSHNPNTSWVMSSAAFGSRATRSTRQPKDASGPAFSLISLAPTLTGMARRRATLIRHPFVPRPQLRDAPVSLTGRLVALVASGASGCTSSRSSAHSENGDPPASVAQFCTRRAQREISTSLGVTAENG